MVINGIRPEAPRAVIVLPVVLAAQDVTVGALGIVPNLSGGVMEAEQRTGGGDVRHDVPVVHHAGVGCSEGSKGGGEGGVTYPWRSKGVEGDDGERGEG